MRKASFVETLAKIQPDLAPALLFDFEMRHMVGIVRISQADGFWEQHNEGDEILVILQGHADFTLRHPDVIERVSVSAGSIIYIPKGVSHGAKIYEEVHILFFTPKEGNISWVEVDRVNTEAVARHRQSAQPAR